MKICQSNKFDTKGGEWCILNDYGCEGISVWGQYNTIEEAIDNLGTCSCPQVIVRLVDFKIETNED